MGKNFIFCFLFLLAFSVNSQVVINEVMYSPTPNTEKEWFEIYNSGSSYVNIMQWKWKDASSNYKTITTGSTILGAYQYAVICDDSASVRQFHPGFSGLIFQTSWTALNNDEDAIILVDGSQNSYLIDSLHYHSSWGGTSGYSLERKNPAGLTNNPLNWGTSVDFQKSTPNRLNSVTPKLYDLYLSSFKFTPQAPKAGDTLNLNFQIKNPGINPAGNFFLNIFRNANLDSVIRPSDLIHAQNFSPFVLNPNDSMTYSYSITGIDSGLKQFIGKIVYAADLDTTNNLLVKNVRVNGNGIIISNGLIINEIMYHPQSSLECEWVELYNNTGSPINLNNWKISDSSTQSNPIIILTDKIIGAYDYIVISKNRTILNAHRLIDSNKVVYLSNLPALNDDKDVVTIYNNAGEINDRVSYKSSWGGNNARSSLERKSPNGLPGDSASWGTSIDCEYSSPTRVNSFSNLAPYLRKDIIINEIMYDPLSVSCEWIEFYNPTYKFLNVSGWRLNVSSNFYNLSDTCNLVINPGQYLVVAFDTSLYNRFTNLRNPDQSRKLIFNHSLNLSNEGAMVRILDALNNVIDSVYYSPNWHNGNLPDTKGYSLERINPQLNSNDRSNWNSSTALLGGTPGTRNSIFIENTASTNSISVSPNPFSPDGDGFEDFAIIKYKLKPAISQLRVKVYDVKGRLVRTLLNNQLSGSEGQIIFDGKNDSGEKLRIGIYILFIEAINDIGGTIEQNKATVVIAAKL